MGPWGGAKPPERLSGFAKECGGIVFYFVILGFDDGGGGGDSQGL